MAIDKFTKWIEVKPVTCPKADRVLDFLDKIIHRYGFPNSIITDLGSDFNNHAFWEYRENNGSTSGTSPLLTHGPMARLSVLTGWFWTL